MEHGTLFNLSAVMQVTHKMMERLGIIGTFMNPYYLAITFFSIQMSLYQE